jgi:hypothetical protein
MASTAILPGRGVKASLSRNHRGKLSVMRATTGRITRLGEILVSWAFLFAVEMMTGRKGKLDPKAVIEASGKPAGSSVDREMVKVGVQKVECVYSTR